MNQSWPEQGAASASGWERWHLPANPAPVDAGDSGALSSGQHSAHQGGAGQNPPSGAAQPSFDGSGWDPVDYRTYMALAGRAYAPPANPAADAEPAPASPPAASTPGSGAIAPPPTSNAAMALPTLPNAQTIAQSAIDVLWRNWQNFDSGDSVFKTGITAALNENRIPVQDRAPLQQLLDNPEAFDWLDRLDLNRDGSISRDMLATYVATGAAPQAPVATDVGVNTDPTDDVSLAAVTDNFGAIDGAADGSQRDGSVTQADIATAGNSAALDTRARSLLGALGSDASLFAQYDNLDGSADGLISSSGLYAKLQGDAPADATLAPPAGVQGAEAARYSDNFYALVNEIANNPASVGTDANGVITSASLAASTAPTVTALASDPFAFRQLDGLDGRFDGQVTVKDVNRLINPSQYLYDSSVTLPDGSQQSVMAAVMTQLPEDYKTADVLPPLPEGVNNDNERAYRMLLAVYDNFYKLVDKPADGSAPVMRVTHDQLLAASSNPDITAEDKVLLAELARDIHTYDWLAFDEKLGMPSTSLTFDHLQKVVSAWHKAHFGDITQAYLALGGLDGFKAGEGASAGFDAGMTGDFLATQVFDPATVNKYFERLMSDPAIQADIQSKISQLLPDAASRSQAMHDTIAGPAYAGYLAWLGKQGVDPKQIGSHLSGDLFALGLMNRQLADQAGEVASRRMLGAQLENYGYQELANGNTGALKTLFDDLLQEALRGSRTAARFLGNALAVLDDLKKLTPELDRVINSVLPGVMGDTVEDATRYLNEQGLLKQNNWSTLNDLNRSGTLGALAGVFGYVLGAYTMISHSTDGLAATTEERLQEALSFIAPLSYSHQFVKYLNSLSGDMRGPLANFSDLASRSFADLLGVNNEGFDRFGNDVRKLTQEAADVAGTIPETTIRLAQAWKFAIPMLDTVGGVIAAVLGTKTIRDGLKSQDDALTASGYLLTSAGGVWSAGGLVSLFCSVASGPFFAMSGLLALGGLLAEAFRDPTKQFAQGFVEQYGVMEEIGGLRQNWRDNLRQWYRDHYFDKASNSGMGIDM